MKIPNILIERLKQFGPRFIKVEVARQGDPKSGKRAIENGFQFHLYNADDPSLINHLERGGGYGVLAGDGLWLLDTDGWKIKELDLPGTFTVETGSGEGNHGYFWGDIEDNGTISKNGKHMGEIRAKYMYVVGPNCKHYTGGVYKIIDESPMTRLNQEKLEEVIKKWGGEIAWSKKVKKDIDEAADQEQDSIGMKIPIEELMDLKDLREMGGDEYQGAHPIHGSTTGQNFTVNTDKNVWHCFRHNSGGGPLSWIAVKYGIIKCEEALPGRLRGETFADAMRKANELGYKVEFLPEVIEGDVKKFFKGKTFKPKILGDTIKENHPIITVEEAVFVYDRSEGIYIERGEPWVRAIAARMLDMNYKSARVAETVKYVMDTTIRKALPETPPNLVAVANGILDVEKGVINPFTSDVFILTKMPVVFDNKADCPLFRKCMEMWVTKDDGQVLKEFAGYTLWGENIYAKFAMLLGPTRSGKSTYENAIESVVGKNNISHVRLQDLGEDKYAAADLFGKMLNTAAELSEGEIRNTDLIKSVTGRDPIRAREIYGRPFSFKPRAKMQFAMNNLPDVKMEDDAFFNRIIKILFIRQFFIGTPGTDPELDKKLAKEAPGILNWMLEGLHRLREKGGFPDNKNTAEAKEQYRILKDPFEYFFGKFTESTNDYNDAIGKQEFYDTYAAFCKAHRAAPKSTYEVSARMKEKEIRLSQIKFDETDTRCWMGIRWTECMEEFPNLTSFRKNGQKWERKSPDSDESINI